MSAFTAFLIRLPPTTPVRPSPTTPTKPVSPPATPTPSNPTVPGTKPLPIPVYPPQLDAELSPVDPVHLLRLALIVDTPIGRKRLMRWDVASRVVGYLIVGSTKMSELAARAASSTNEIERASFKAQIVSTRSRMNTFIKRWNQGKYCLPQNSEKGKPLQRTKRVRGAAAQFPASIFQ